MIDDATSLNFYKSEAPRVKRTNSKLHINADCHYCRYFGHFKSHYPNRSKKDSKDNKEEVGEVSNF